jgi:hypothetical protein
MLRVVGAGLGRTATVSLKLALELLLEGPCYHMTEQMNRPADAAVWAAALRNEAVDWPAFLDGWEATVDWPACAVYDQLADAFPDAKVLLSSRDPVSWWESATRTIIPSVRRLDEDHPMRHYLETVLGSTGVRLDDRDASIAAFIAHNDRVRASFGPERLIEWHPGDGWAPLCAGLGLPVPDVAFPHENSSSSYAAMIADARAGNPPRNAQPPPYEA